MRQIFLLFFTVIILSGCGSSSNSFTSEEVIRKAVDTPEAFQHPEMDEENKVCRSPLTDPRTGAEITFLRASWPYADFEVPTGRYGVNSGELLRVNCETGEAVGIVKR